MSQFLWLNLKRLWVLKTQRLLTSRKLKLKWWIIKRAWVTDKRRQYFAPDRVTQLHCLWERVWRVWFKWSVIQIWWQVAFNYILHFAQLTSLFTNVLKFARDFSPLHFHFVLTRVTSINKIRKIYKICLYIELVCHERKM